MEKERVKVQIDGMNFYVVGDDNPEYIRELAKELNEILDLTTRSNARLNQMQTQILTALNLLDRSKKLDKKIEEVKKFSQDANVASKRVDELEEMRRQTSEFQEKKAEVEKRMEVLKQDKRALELETQDLSLKLDSCKEEINKLKIEEEKKEKRIEELEENNYRAQMKVADLNKEISVLRGEVEA